MRYLGFIFKIKAINPAFENALLKFSQTGSFEQLKVASSPILYGVHPEIIAKCISMYTSGNHAEAVEKSFKIVRDKLRELTGFETGSEAFGNGGLHIKGAAAPNVDPDFNHAVKFLLMAIDMFRNEKSHTSDAKIDDPLRAYQYLSMSSLALYFLENSEIKRK